MDNILINIKEDLITVIQDGKKLLIDKNNKVFEKLMEDIKDKSRNEAKEIIRKWYEKDRFNIL
jgi:hypothetical protein